MPLLPVALNLRGVRVLVVGGGGVAARKVKSLRECGAHIHVVAPQLNEEMTALLPQLAEYSAREFLAADCDGCRLVFACTDSHEVNAAIANAAHAANALCHISDDGENSDFHGMAEVRRGDILIGISTGGGSPALSKHLREKIEAGIGAEYSELLKLMRAMRGDLKNHLRTQEERAAFWARVLESEMLFFLRRGEEADARRVLRQLWDEARPNEGNESP